MIKLKSLVYETIDKEIHKIGYDPDEIYPDMPIDWDAKDIQVLNKWDINSIREFAGKPKSFVAIYKSILDVSDLDYSLAEEDPEDEVEGGYDWDEFRMKHKGFPPILVMRTKEGYIKTLDGNHRIKWAYEMNYRTIGVWVVDELLQKEIDKKKK